MNSNAYRSQLSWHSCAHQAAHFQASGLYVLPYACDSSPRQKGFAGTNVYFPSHPAKADKGFKTIETVEDNLAFIYAS